MRLQRGFVPFEPKKRLYATSVGTPQGVHYAYDLETGALLRAWRGPWIDTAEMWEGRGESQLAKPTGPALTLNAKPTVALIEKAATAGWPESADALQEALEGCLDDLDGFYTFLVGTAEPSLLAYYSDEVLKQEDLPLKVCGYSQCYRCKLDIWRFGCSCNDYRR